MKAARFPGIAGNRAGAAGIDMANGFGSDAGLVQSGSNCPGQTLTREAAVEGCAKTHHLSIDLGAALSCVFRFFQNQHAGMAAATFYLLLPYTAILIGQLHHVWPITLIVWAVVAYRLPTLAGLLLGLAAGSVYFPALVFPVWLSFYWRRGAGRFAAAFVLAAGIS